MGYFGAAIASFSALLLVISARIFGPLDVACPSFFQRVHVPSSYLKFSDVDALLNSSFTSGGVVYTVFDTESCIQLNSFGYADERARQSITSSTLFRIASVTKIFPTLMALLAREQNIIDLDDPVSKFVPEFSYLNSFGSNHQITWRSLLMQLSGLPRNDIFNSTTDALKVLKKSFLVHKPFSRPSYSNLGFSFLGRLLEPAFGETFEVFAEKRILAPMNMTETGFLITPEVIEKLATGYTGGKTVKPGIILGWDAPAGQAYSSSNDLQILIQELLREGDGSVISANSKNLLMGRRETWLLADGKAGWGMLWEQFIHTMPDGRAILMLMKAGNMPGYSSAVIALPELGVGITILWNSDVDEFVFANKLVAFLAPQLVKYTTENQPALKPCPQEYRSKINGTYSTLIEPAGIESVFVSVASDGTLSISQQGLFTPNRTIVAMDHIADLAFRVPFSWTGGDVSCSSICINAVSGEVAYFYLSPSGTSILEVPGLISQRLYRTM